MQLFTTMSKGRDIIDKTCRPEYKHTFTANIKIDDSTHELLNEICSVPKSILIVERSKGFTEIHSETAVEYTTEDIMRKGL